MSDSDDDELLNLSSDKKKSKWRKMIFQETSEKELGNFIIYVRRDMVRKFINRVEKKKELFCKNFNYMLYLNDYDELTSTKNVVFLFGTKNTKDEDILVDMSY